jgi:anti-sigma regulatory factor (Ser/Thr protein kinase)
VQTNPAPVTLRLPFSATSVGVARHRLKDWMQQVGLDREQMEDARVVVSELVGNSVRHARPLPDGCIIVTWALEPRGIRLSVTDGGGATRPRRLHAPSSALAGRGMAIVDTLAVGWWSETTRSKSTLHAILGA